MKKQRLFWSKIQFLKNKANKIPKKDLQTIMFRAKNFEEASGFVAAYSKKIHTDWRFDLTDVSDVIIVGEI